MRKQTAKERKRGALREKKREGLSVRPACCPPIFNMICSKDFRKRGAVVVGSLQT